VRTNPAWFASHTGGFGRYSLGEQRAGLNHPQLTLTIAQKTKVADLNEALWQQMQTEPADKLPNRLLKKPQQIECLVKRYV